MTKCSHKTLLASSVGAPAALQGNCLLIGVSHSSTSELYVTLTI